jgi:hypothetical protein
VRMTVSLMLGHLLALTAKVATDRTESKPATLRSVPRGDHGTD